jgi:formate dehydrogenase subunit beta
MKQTEQEIRSNIEKLLKQQKINTFIGYEKGSLPLRTSPCFVSSANDISRLVWDNFCVNNLVVYLPRIIAAAKEKGSFRVGIICKGCDSRSLVELIKEKQIYRDQIYIIGISCPGMLDHRKILSDIRIDDFIDVEDTNDEVIVKLKKGDRVFRKEDYLCEACLYCKHPVPAVYDILIKTEQQSRQIVEHDLTIDNFAKKSRQERWDNIEQEFSRCIRCYACRKVCPNCYCNECFAEQTNPSWLGISTDLSDIIFYHIVRIFHQAGRCVDCGACARACPMDINLQLLTRMLVEEVKERFGYEPGVMQEELQPFATYSVRDKQDFMVDPE